MKSPEQLADLYYRSVGHNATLLLNFPVDREGLIHPIDSANAVNFHKMIQRELQHNLVAGMTPKVSNERGKAFAAKAMTDDSWDTYWATADGVTSATITFDFKKPQLMNRIMLQEYIPLGQRVKKFAVEYLDGKTWRSVEQGEETTTIGYKRLLRFRTVEAKSVRVRIIDSRGPICLNNVGIYYGGKDAQLTWNPTAEAIKSVQFSILGADKAEWEKAADRNPQTVWFCNGNEVLIDLGSEQEVSALQYLPDQSEGRRGLIHTYTIAACDAKGGNERVLKSGEFSNLQNNPILQTVSFNATKTRYLKLRAERMVVAGEAMGIAELGVK